MLYLATHVHIYPRVYGRYRKCSKYLITNSGVRQWAAYLPKEVVYSGRWQDWLPRNSPRRFICVTA